MEAGRAVQQSSSVPGTRDWLNEQQQARAPQEAAEDGGGHHNQRRHHDKTEDDEGGAAVVVKVTADGRVSIEDLQGPNTEVLIRRTAQSISCFLCSAERRRDWFVSVLFSRLLNVLRRADFSSLQAVRRKLCSLSAAVTLL